MLKVAFIYAPLGHEVFEENLKIVDEDFGRLPPISLAYAASIAEAAGHEVRIVDANARRLNVEDVIRELRPFEPDILAFTLTTYMFRQTTRWMRELKMAFGIPVVAGGINVQLYPAATLTCDAIDYGILHFGVQGLPALLDAIEHGRDPVGLPEVVARDPNGSVIIGPIDPVPNPYLHMPPPARHLLPNALYHSIVSQRRNFTVMVTSTGCPMPCRYCAIPSRPRYRNPIDRVMAEIRECHQVHGVREIDFFDADFFVNRKWSMEFCQRLIDEHLDLEWSCRAGLDRLDREILELARKSGCRQIYVGIETPEPAALSLLRKNLSMDRVRERLQEMRDTGIRALGFFMIGVPGETHASALHTIRYALSLPIDYAQFSRMIAKPGSDLQKELVERTGSDYWEDWVRGLPVPSRVPNLWSTIGEDAIEAWTKFAYIAFYYRPGYVLKALGRMRSADETWRSARTAMRMLGGALHFDRSRKVQSGCEDREDSTTSH